MRGSRIVKKSISMIIVFSILLSIFVLVVPAFAETNAEVALQQEDFRFASEFGFFDGLYEQGDENLPIKRWEFLKVCLRLINAQPVQSFNDVFVDVPESKEYAPYVYTAYSLGWISLNKEARFNPDAPITLEQASKILVTITGFVAQAESQSGYPAGYLEVAYRNNILNGINIGSESNLTFSSVAKMMYNLFKSPFAYPVGIGDGVIYDYGEHTVYSYYHKLYKDRGIVTAVKNGRTGINSPVLSDEEIEIDNILFSTDNTYSNLIGKNVEYFYYSYDDTDEKTIFLIYQDKSNKELVIDRENFHGFGNDFVIRYEDSNYRIKEEKINSSVNVLYNDNYAYKMVNYPLDTMGNADKIRLLDNNGDNKWDYVFVEKTELYFIDTVATESLYFDSFYNSAPVSLSELSSSDMPNITKAGKNINFSNIKKYNVAEVKKDFTQTKILSIDITSDDVTGVISSYVSDGEEGFVTIDGKEYEVHEIFLNSSDFNIGIGNEATFALSKDGKIVGYKKKNMNKGYGYLLDMWTVPHQHEYKLRVKMLNFEGEVVSYEFADKFTVDSMRYKNASKETFETIISEIKKTGCDSNYIGGIYESEASLIPNTISLKNGIHQLVVYTLDDNLNVNKLDTVKDDENNMLARDIMPKFHTNASPSTRYLSAGYIIADLNSNTRFIMSADTLVYSVPVNGKDEPENYLVGDRTLLPGLEYHTVHAYNVDPETMIAEVVVAEKGDAKNSGLQPEAGTGKRREFITITLDSTKYHVITKVTQALDLNGDPVTKVYTLNKKQEDYFFVSNETFTYDYKEYKEKGENNVIALNNNSLKAGQIVAANIVPANKYAKTICVVGNPPSNINSSDATSIVGVSGYDECIFGRLVSKKNATIQAEVYQNGEWLTYAYNIGSSAEVYRCSANGNIEVFDLNSINYEINRYVFVRSRVGKIPIVVVYDY